MKTPFKDISEYVRKNLAEKIIPPFEVVKERAIQECMRCESLANDEKLLRHKFKTIKNLIALLPHLNIELEERPGIYYLECKKLGKVWGSFFGSEENYLMDGIIELLVQEVSK